MIQACKSTQKVAASQGALYNQPFHSRVSVVEFPMSTLPLSFRFRDAVVEKHQLEGTDPSDRYFNRIVPVKHVKRGYVASMLYEALVTESSVHQTVGGAIKDMVGKLRLLGFTRMRTRVNFKGQAYLAEKESWVEYPD